MVRRKQSNLDSMRKKKSRVRIKRNAYKQRYFTSPPGIYQARVTQGLMIVAEFTALKLLCGGLWYHYTFGVLCAFLLSNSIFICCRLSTHSLIFQTYKYPNTAVLVLNTSLPASDIWYLSFEPTVCMPTDKRAPLVKDIMQVLIMWGLVWVNL